MELIKSIVPEVVSYVGGGNVNISTPKRLLIKAGEDTVLNEQVPAGKVWTVSINVSIVEKEA